MAQGKDGVPRCEQCRRIKDAAGNLPTSFFDCEYGRLSAVERKLCSAADALFVQGLTYQDGLFPKFSFVFLH